MKFLRVLIFFFLSLSAAAQPKFEVQEFTGVVKSIVPGYRFALEFIIFDVNGRETGFSFFPSYGTFINEHIKPGDQISLKANVNLRMNSLREEMRRANKPLEFFMFNDRIMEIKINGEWISLAEKEEGYIPGEHKVFLEKKVINDYFLNGRRNALLFEDGMVASYMGSTRYPGPINSVKVGDVVSFMGHKTGIAEGYKYPVDGVTAVYHFNQLKQERGKAFSYLFKQNSVCIGVKFNLPSGKQLSVSFPTEDAERVKHFLNTNDELRIYYFENKTYEVEDMLHPPELHALVKTGDTLYINKFGFYGGADGKHDYKDVQVNGKITRINTSARGNIISLLVASDYYVEIDAMMAQQLGHFFQKGKEVSIQGKERIRKEGEIYQKDHRIVTPEKVVVDGKTFLLHNP